MERLPYSDLPPGVTMRDIDRDERPVCDICGRRFNGEYDDEVCPRCEAKEDEHEND